MGLDLPTCSRPLKDPHSSRKDERWASWAGGCKPLSNDLGKHAECPAEAVI